MATMQAWIAGARPRTLPAAISPVLIGGALALIDFRARQVELVTSRSLLTGGLALVVALLLQIGVNFANDYSDGIRGTDQVRVGPIRLVGQNLAAAIAVRNAAFLCFGLAAVFGFWLVWLSGNWWLLLVGGLAIISAWFYTGGNHPYGYYGFGELFVFVWFGLAAVLGTEYTTSKDLNRFSLPLAVAAGAFACALLVVNNLRDIPNDEQVGKRTLAVRMGDSATRWFYVALIWTGLGTSIAMVLLAVLDREVSQAWLGLGLLAALPAHKPGRAVLSGVTGKDLIPVLGATGRCQVVWAVATCLGVLLYLQ